MCIGQRFLLAGLSGLSAMGVACAADAAITADFSQTPSTQAGYVLSDLEVTSTSDWVFGQVLVELTAGELLYFTPGVAPAQVSDVYDNSANPQSATRPYAWSPLQGVNSDIPGLSSSIDAASLLDNPPDPGDGNFVPATASLTRFDLTWFGPPTQTSDTGTANLLNVTASNNATGTWAILIGNDTVEDDLLISGVVFRGMLLESQPIAGDANLDGSVNLSDFSALKANFGLANATWLEGDFSGDGTINLTDFSILKANFGSSAASEQLMIASIPEPGSAVLLGTLGLFFARNRRKR